ncbi:urease accessory protein [Microvirga tunisiensis]|uniref:Urease accessory protein UreD n=1 Tax=Pannonibacter tanglangensis TaxID=2750084 RepID=A0ABW9ZKW6_9HYPH|nr:urease accessory protein [Pannonibacter sp. XCT-34]
MTRPLHARPAGAHDPSGTIGSTDRVRSTAQAPSAGDTTLVPSVAPTRVEVGPVAGASLSPRLQRAVGEAHVRFVLRRDQQAGSGPGVTGLDRLGQSGSAKIRLPRVYDGTPVAVMLNTAGGITGGDRLAFTAEAGTGCHAVVTTQAAERAYRSPGGAGELSNRVTVGDGATLEWLPQETMLFDRSHLRRSLQVDLTGTARFMGLEMVVLGREAMGETVATTSFRDAWTIRRDGRLIYADTISFGPHTDGLQSAATLGGARAFATFIDCGPEAEGNLALARALIADLPLRAGVSAWNGRLLARFLGSGSRVLRDGLMQFLHAYRGRPLPRVWHC